MATKTRNDGERLVALETRMGSVQDDVKEVKSLVTSLGTKMDAFGIALTKVDTLEDKITSLEAEITGLKGVNSLKNTLLWVGLVASAIINIVTLYNIFGT